MDTESIDITPSPNLIEVLGNSGYTLSSALADIIDNSLAHSAKEISITLNARGLASSLTILDNGEGMNESQLIEAFRFAPKNIKEDREANDLGRYGVGLKAASKSFCGKLSIVSKNPQGDLSSFYLPFAQKEWKIYRRTPGFNEIPYASGTKIIWNDLKLDPNPEVNQGLLDQNAVGRSNILSNLIKYLGKVFCLFIQNGVRITINGDPVEAWSPFIAKDADIEKIYENRCDFKVPGTDDPIVIKAYHLPALSRLSDSQIRVLSQGCKDDMPALQGFYLYRGNRLIQSGGWMDIPGLSTQDRYQYARIGIWIPASKESDEYFSLNYSKDQCQIPLELQGRLKSIAEKARKYSTRSYAKDSGDKLSYVPRIQKQNEDVWIIDQSQGFSTFALNEKNAKLEKLLYPLSAKQKKELSSLLADELNDKSARFNFSVSPVAPSLSNDEIKCFLKGFLSNAETEQLTEKQIVESLQTFPIFKNKDNLAKVCFIYELLFKKN